MALGSCGHRITHQLRPINMNGRSILSVTSTMELRGRVHNGVVVLEGELPLPEGAVVTVSYTAPSRVGPPDSRRRVRLPLVPSDRPGSRPLTAERVAELLEDEDVSG